jgi:hypothetical protein
MGSTRAVKQCSPRGLGDFGEGAYFFDGTRIRIMAQTGLPAPGGGTFGAGVWSNIGLDELGNAVFTHQLDDVPGPLGLNAGVYRYSAQSDTTTALVVTAPNG